MWTRLLDTSEGGILLMGLVMALLSIAGLALGYLKSAEKSQVLLAITAKSLLHPHNFTLPIAK